MSQSELVQEVEESISRGERGATLIPWALALALFSVRDHDPAFSIMAAINSFVDAGWTWNQKTPEIDKDGWYAFFRSQGEMSPPIIQWQRRT